MLKSSLSKVNEWTLQAVCKKYSSETKARHIEARCIGRSLRTQRPLLRVKDTVVFEYVEGVPLIRDQTRSFQYLQAYHDNIQPCTADCVHGWRKTFLYSGPRAEPYCGDMHGLLNYNWHGDMCPENVIVDCKGGFTDIDIRGESYGDVYYDFGKFMRGLVYDSLSDTFFPKSFWRKTCLMHLDFLGDLDYNKPTIVYMTKVVFNRMGRLHNRPDFIKMGTEVCKELY